MVVSVGHVQKRAWAATKRWSSSTLSRICTIGLAVSVVVACSPTDLFTPKLTSDIGLTATPTGSKGVVPTPVSAVDANLAPISSEQGLGLVANAWLVLVNQYVEPLDYRNLLFAAWNAYVAALPSGRLANVMPPTFSGTDPQADMDAFEEAYLGASASISGPAPMHSSLAYAAIRGMVKEIGDCHTGFSTPAQVAESNQRMDGVIRFAGIGVRIKRKKDEPAIVYELIQGGSAGKSGIKPGDALLAVEGGDLTDLPLDEIAARIRGKEGTTVKLKIQHPGENSPRDITVPRVAITEASVESRTLANDRVAYVRMNSFSSAAQDQALNSIGTMQAKATKGIVLDLRTNGGGDLNVYLSFLSKFLKDGPFGFEISRKGDRIALGPDGSYVGTRAPMIVLVSDSTASAAEGFSAAVQRYGVAKVLGTKTAGCVGIGSRFGLPDGSAIAVTTRKLTGPRGEELNRIGLTPDEVVEVSRTQLAAGKDPVLDRALILLGA